MAIVVAPRPNLTWWDRLYFPSIIKGLFVTFGHIFRRKVTLQFPEQQWAYPAKYRGYPELIMGDNGLEKCVACKLCEVVCPPIAIKIDIEEYSDQDKRERIPAKFTIDMGRCILCGMCEEACPCDAIRLSNVHVMSSGSREGVVFEKQLLLDDYHSIETMRK